MDENKKGDLLVPSSGVEGTRTPVQTYPSKAFYMFIPALLVGKQQETDEPIVSLAGWSFANGTAYGCSILYLFLSRRRSLVTDQPAHAALMTT